MSKIFVSACAYYVSRSVFNRLFNFLSTTNCLHTCIIHATSFSIKNEMCRIAEGDRKANVDVLEANKAANKEEIKRLRDENKELRQKLALLQRTSAKEEVSQDYSKFLLVGLNEYIMIIIITLLFPYIIL